MPISPISSASASTYWSVAASATSRVGGAERAASTTLSQADLRPAADNNNVADHHNGDAQVASSSVATAENASGSRRATERASDVAADQRVSTDTASPERKAEKNAENKSTENPLGTPPTRPDGTPLTEQEIRQVEQLKQIDQDVRQHERAHEIAGGPYAGRASYDYQSGPDGQRYAVAGEVPIDYGPVTGNPQATVEKMQTVISAALAPVDPSPKDLQVAAQARQYLLEAKLEAARLQSEMNNARSASDTSTQPTADTPYPTAEPDNTPPHAA